MSFDGLPSPHHSDIALLRSGHRRRLIFLLKVSAAVIAFLLVAVLGIVLTHQQQASEFDQQKLLVQLNRINAPWSIALASSYAAYEDWLRSHGTNFEVNLFSEIGSLLLNSIVTTVESSSNENSLSLLSSLLVTTCSGLVRVSFLIIALSRLWLVVCGVGAFYSFYRFKPHTANDLLGQTGNGRHFYSGMRVGLDKVTAQGAPDTLIRGLACLKSANISEIKKSEVWSTLQSYEAVNQTNENLIGFILNYRTTAAFVSSQEEDLLLNSVLTPTSLADFSVSLCRATLSLHALYAAGEVNPTLRALNNAGSTPTPDQYVEKLKSSLNRVLSHDERALIGALTPSEIATISLATQCGKILGYSFEGGRWISKSNFPQLNARAVMHSVVAFPNDYDYDTRQRLRRALVYSSRHSPFAPVRMPIDLSNDAWALRQWVELINTPPHNLAVSADEVELVGLLRTVHDLWLQNFLDSSTVMDRSISALCFATPSKLLLVPLEILGAFIRKSSTPALLLRLESLIDTVNQREKLYQAELETSQADNPSIGRAEHLLPLISEKEINELTNLHGVSADLVKAWSVFRIVLSSYGWLSRRVGDYSVPESSLIFAVVKGAEPASERNSLGLLGKVGMIPLRGTRLAERWGENWGSRFNLVTAATMAESREDYENLLRGIDRRDSIELDETEGLSTAQG